jgi:hypothetical protein
MRFTAHVVQWSSTRRVSLSVHVFHCWLPCNHNSRKPINKKKLQFSCLKLLKDQMANKISTRIMSTSLARSYPSISLQHAFQLHHIFEHSLLLVMLCLNYALQPLRLIVASWLDVPTFVTRRLHAWYHARAPSGGRWNCGQEMLGNFA